MVRPVVVPEPDRTPTGGTPRPVVPYAELHCHSNFSFLDGASHPEELAEEAHRLGLTALAVTDHNGLYGVVRFAEAARVVGLPTVFGSEITSQPTEVKCLYILSLAPQSRATTFHFFASYA